MNGAELILMDCQSDATAQTVEGVRLSFDDAFVAHHRVVYRYAYALTRDPGLAEGVAQEVFVRLHQHLDAAQRDGLLRAWLLRVAANVSRNAVRGLRRARSRDESFVARLLQATPPAAAGRRGKTHRPRFVKKLVSDIAQNSLPEPGVAAPAPAAVFSEGETFFDFETTRHLEKAQVLLRSFENAPSPSAGELAYDKRVSKELLFRNILLRREAEGAENAPAKSLLGSLEPFLLDIANLPARPASGDLASVKRRIRKSEIVAVLQVYSTPTASLD